MDGNAMTEAEFANLSDDEISAMAFPPRIESGDAGAEIVVEEGDNQAGNTDANAVPDADLAGSSDAPADAAVAEADDEDDADPEPDLSTLDDEAIENGAGKPGKAALKTQVAEKASADVAADPAGSKPDEAAAPTVVVNYQEAYDKIMAPFRANGKEIKLDNPDDVVRLMQMGANYTQKLQALQPNLKILKMLENNQLLDEGKLGYLIDLDKKNPAAIKQIIKDSGIDPMEVDTREDTGYIAGNHQISDAEMAFTSTVEELARDTEGKNLIVSINKNWDQSSKDLLWEDPSILRVLTEQRKSGIYDQITAEVDRRKVLGTIQNVNFLTAYQSVGQDLHQKGLLKVNAQPSAKVAPAASQTARVVDQGTAARKPSGSVINSDKARAASVTKAAATKQVKQDFNPLAMSDEDFEKSTDLARRL